MPLKHDLLPSLLKREKTTHCKVIATKRKKKSTKQTHSTKSPRGNKNGTKTSNLNVTITPLDNISTAQSKRTTKSAPTGSKHNGAQPKNNQSAINLPRVKQRPATTAMFHPETQSELKKKRSVSLLNSLKPANLEIEKLRFLQSQNFEYEPQFVYRYPIRRSAKHKFSKASDRFIFQAIHILKHAIKIYGSYKAVEDYSGGRTLRKHEIYRAARQYIKDENMENEIQVKLSEDLVARAMMVKVKGQGILNIRAHGVRDEWMSGLLKHEIGTHYLRSYNNLQHPWRDWKRRKDLNMEPVNPTEEGLASLHSVLFRQHPVLWRAAILYYATYKAAKLSFSQLFKDLGKFMTDPLARWDYCLRVKRGITDTSIPGCFSKDQVYLEGALLILRDREYINFHLLLQLGKISYNDIDNVKHLTELNNTRIPSFMKDLTLYRANLEHILAGNGLTDDILHMEHMDEELTKKNP
ncbi:unnamed protein product [Owenia fusiformis]|uniref:Uncharacterized protein n=1 Tax=Owenia fusiformis TaxID=6347 RepID=A0A8J1UW78_OWEFU|nr:unnamed protein product [Owenia fusiformis]